MGDGFGSGRFGGLFGAREEAAREQVRVIRSAAREAYVSVEERWGQLRADLLVQRSALADDDALGRDLDDLERRAEEVIAAVSTAMVGADAEHDPDELTGLPALQQADPRWRHVAAGVDAATAAVARVDAAVRGIEGRDRWCRQILAQVGGRTAEAAAAVSHAGAVGLDVPDLDADLMRVTAATDRVGQALATGQLALAHHLCTGIDADLTRVHTAARGVVHRQQDLVARHGALREALARTGALAQEVAVMVASLRSRFPSTVWQSVEGAPDQAAQERRAGSQSLDRASRLGSLEEQRFEEAEAELARAQQAVEALRTMHAAVAGIVRDVEAATREYAAVHDTAARSLAQARSFIEQRPQDVNPALRSGIGRASEELLATERRVATGHADPFLVHRALREVQRYADEVLMAARSDAQRRDAHRSRVSADARQVQRDLHRARSVVRFTLGRSGTQARQALMDAQGLLDEAGRLIATDPATANHLVWDAGRIVHEVLRTWEPRR